MNIILFDTESQRENLLPLAYTRPIAEFRCGIFKLSEKWSERGQSVSFLTEKYLSEKYPARYTNDNLYINGAILYTTDIWEKVQSLEDGEAIVDENAIILAVRTSQKLVFNFEIDNFRIENFDAKLIKNVYDIFQLNGEEIKSDFGWITANNTSKGIDDNHTVIYNSENVFVEEGANIKAAVLNAEGGPIYIGKNAEIQEGVLIKGPFALCENAVVNMGGKMKGDTTIGPFSKVGGEVSNSVIFGYSNKGHDGFIGNTVIGEWCNLGADTNTSNLKNDYGNVKLWNYAENKMMDTGLQFCGLIMGDHSKSGINTMFNTGTLVGINSNIYGGDFPVNFIPSFSWGGSAGFTTYRPQKAYEVAKKVMERRKVDFSTVEKDILDEVFERSAMFRDKD